jgi:hypothetical protein
MSRESILARLVKTAEEERDAAMKKVRLCCRQEKRREDAGRDADVYYALLVVNLKRIDELGMTVNADLSPNPLYRKNRDYRKISNQLALDLREMQDMAQLIEEGRYKPRFNY